MKYAILKTNRWPMFGAKYAVEAVNTETTLKIALPLNNLKNYMHVHKEAIKMV